MRSVIIDDGIYPGFIPIPNITDRYIVKNGQICSGYTSSYLSHGTVGAAIIEDICPGTSWISICVLDETRKGMIDDVLVALEWCLNSSIKLIHMSIGTCVYHDGERMASIISRLIKNGAIIVAAYSNYNIPTWPACLPGVVGVRSVLGNELQPGQYALDKNCVLPFPNSIVARTKRDIFGQVIECQNSYAAYLLTTKILENGLTLDKTAILKKLQLFSTRTDYLHPYCDYSSWENIESHVPIIHVKSGKYLLSKLAYMFQEDGYNPAALSFQPDERCIPLKLYAVNGDINGLTAIIERIYSPGIILFECLHFCNCDFTTTDAFVECNGSYILLMENSRAKFETVDELYNSLITQLTKQYAESDL